MSDRSYSFPTTGSAEGDRLLALRIQKSMKHHDEGTCPNGHGPLIVDSPSELHCAGCRYTYTRFGLEV